VKHVDEWLDEITFDENEAYAKFVLDNMRWPAWKKTFYEKWMRPHKLFCTYEGDRWRVTGASRMGDVWLTKNFDQETGYQKRVDVDACTAWGPAP
jgi:hypothetical protein